MGCVAPVRRFGGSPPVRCRRTRSRRSRRRTRVPSPATVASVPARPRPRRRPAAPPHRCRDRSAMAVSASGRRAPAVARAVRAVRGVDRALGGADPRPLGRPDAPQPQQIRSFADLGGEREHRRDPVLARLGGVGAGAAVAEIVGLGDERDQRRRARRGFGRSAAGEDHVDAYLVLARSAAGDLGFEAPGRHVEHDDRTIAGVGAGRVGTATGRRHRRRRPRASSSPGAPVHAPCRRECR